MSSAKEEARKIIDNLPEHATWDDIWYQLYVNKKIDKALKDADEGKVVDHDVVKERFKDQ